MKNQIKSIKKQFLLIFLINFILLFFIPYGIIYSQENEIDTIQNLRAKWFWNIRKYPYDTLASNLYYNFNVQKFALRNSHGFATSQQNNWTCLGPTPANACFLSSGRVSCVAYDKRDNTGQTILIGGASGGLWKTTDGGSNWYPKTDNQFSLASGYIAIDPNINGSNSIIYYGTGEGVNAVGTYYGCGLLKSTNAGENWILIDSASGSGLPAQTKFFKIAIRPNYPNELLAALHVGLYRSTDAGLHWSKLLIDNNYICSDVVYSADGNTSYAVGPKPGCGYWISTDGGSNWSNQYDFTDQNYRITKLALCGNNSNSPYVYVLSDFGGNTCPTMLFRSSDYGYTFDFNRNIGDAGQWMGDYVIVLAVHPTNPAVVYYGNEELFMSLDYGTTTTNIYNGETIDFHAVDFSPDPAYTNLYLICTGTDQGAYTFFYSNGNIRWYDKNSTLTLTQFYGFATNYFNSNVMLGGAQDLGGLLRKSSNLEWEIVMTDTYCGDGANVVASKTNPNDFIYHFTGSMSNAYCTTDGGLTYCNSAGINDVGVYSNSIRNMPMVSDQNVYNSFYVLKNAGDGNGNPGNIIYFLYSTDGGLNFQNDLNRKITQTIGPYISWNQQISLNKANSLVMYATTGDRIVPIQNQLYNTTDGGYYWHNQQVIQNNQIPDRYISHVESDPIYENVIYMTVSGFNSGHVFKSTNYGNNWSDISGNLPNCPANDIMVYFPNCNSELLFVATDAGVYISSDSGTANTTWQEYADGLPNVVTDNFSFNRLQCKLRVGTMGRGAWETDLPVAGGQIFVRDNLLINSDANGVNVNADIVVCNGGKLSIPYSCIINMAQNKKIIVMDGGQIEASSGNAITFTKQSTATSWGGIEIQGSSNDTLINCTFSNTSSPIVIDNGDNSTTTSIIINGCTFNEASVTIDSRPNVTIENCNFNYSTSSGTDTCGISAVNSDNLYLYKNTINYSTSMSPGTGIQIVYGNNGIIDNNTINNTSYGILISNSSPYIANNTITNSEADLAFVGMGLDNSSSAVINYNTVSNYQVGITMFNSSPIMHKSSFVSNNSSGNSDTSSALNAYYYSFPKLSPTAGQGNEYLDAGGNILEENAVGNGIMLDAYSLPYMEKGFNHIYGYTYYIINQPNPGGLNGDYYVTDNCWTDNPPNPQKFMYSGGNIYYIPYSTDCGSGFGGSMKENISFPLFKGSGLPAREAGGLYAERAIGKNDIPPTQPIIVNYGHGIYDTIHVIAQNISVNPDMALFMQGINQEWLGNYTNAVNTYYQVISNYKDSLTAKCSLTRLLYCHDKMHADTGAYSNLRNYYFNQIQSNHNDTSFVKIARDLAAKTLVRLSQLPSAIIEFENIINNSKDTLQIMNSQLNIIEAYMLMNQNQGGNRFSFVGRYKQLKPENIKHGCQMIRDILYKHGYKSKTRAIPTVFKLSQNYPNPFNPTTKIDYQLPNPSKVTIKVYDILGRLVRTLVNNEQKDAGYYSITFDGTSFASGVYFYRIEAGKYVSVKKMVLLK